MPPMTVESRLSIPPKSLFVAKVPKTLTLANGSPSENLLLPTQEAQNEKGEGDDGEARATQPENRPMHFARRFISCKAPPEPLAQF